MQSLERSFPVKIAIFTMACLITLMFWAVLPSAFDQNESSDYVRHYEPAARNLLAGRGLTRADGSPAIKYPPGYPLILAALFGLSPLLHVAEDSLIAVFILCCVGLASMFFFLIARTIWRPLPALLASVIWMTYPFGLWLTKQPNSEIPFLVVFWWSFYVFWCALLHKKRGCVSYFVAGLLAGLAMLIRPIAIGLGLLMVAILWSIGRELPGRIRLFSAAMLLIGNLVAIIPWQVWLNTKTDEVVPLGTVGGRSIQDGLTFGIRLKNDREATELPPDVEALMRHISDRSSEMRSLGNTIGVLFQEISAWPSAFAELLAIKAVRSWYGTDSRRFETESMSMQALYLILLIWASLAAWLQGGPARQLTIIIWLMLLYFWGMTIMALSILRYMVPAIGLSFALVPALFAGSSKGSVKSLGGSRPPG